MSMLVELAVNAAASIGMLGGFTAIKNRIVRKKEKQAKEQHKKSNRPDEWGGWPWETIYSHSNSYDVFGRRTEAYSFCCPKCKKQTVTDLTLCQDEGDYHNPHFHFECKHCKFACILRTADDIQEETEE